MDLVVEAAGASLPWVLCTGAGASVVSAGAFFGYRIPFALELADPDREVPSVFRSLSCGMRSSCERCAQPLPLRALVAPFGWLFGCARCGDRGPVLYPLLEALGAGLAAAAWFVGGHRVEWVLAVLAWLGLSAAAAAADRAAWMVPWTISVPLIWAGLLFSPGVDPMMRIWGACILHILALGAVIGVERFAGSAEEGFGGGDVLLAVAMGAWLGPVYGVIAVLAALTVLVAWMRVRRLTELPFAPFLVVSGSVVLAASWLIEEGFLAVAGIW